VWSEKRMENTKSTVKPLSSAEFTVPGHQKATPPMPPPPRADDPHPPTPYDFVVVC